MKSIRFNTQFTMSAEIYKLKFGINHCYIIKGKDAIMIDGGPTKSGKSFQKQLKSLSFKPKEIKLIVLTHADPDHAGSAKDIKDITGARVAIHEYDRKILEEGRNNWPPGVTPWGKINHFLLYPLFLKLVSMPALKPDITLHHEAYPLDEFGIAGQVIHTPGHTKGSISVLLESGDAFVGCLAHNRFPFTFHPALPIFAEDMAEIKRSWNILLEKGAKMIYPGHGNPFPVEKILKYL
jgi:hydroxyacylglutathione hydrolase